MPMTRLTLAVERGKLRARLEAVWQEPQAVSDEINDTDDNIDDAETLSDGEYVVQSRARLGVQWGLGRPLYAAELGRMLLMGGRDPGETIRNWETGRTRVPGPALVAIEMMLEGANPVWERMSSISTAK